MPTTAQIEEANPTLSDLAKAQITALIRSAARYQEQPGRYPDLAGKLTAADGTITAQQLNATLALIDGVGDGTVRLTGGEDAVDYDQARDHNQLVNYMLDVLYDMPVRKSAVAIGRMRIPVECCPGCGYNLALCRCRVW